MGTESEPVRVSDTQAARAGAVGPACSSLSLVCRLLHVLFLLPSIFFVLQKRAGLASARFSLE